MMKKLIVIVIILFLISPIVSASQTKYQKKNISINNTFNGPNEEILNGRRFLWESPDPPPPDDGYPVLLVLHGATQYAETWFLSGIGGLKSSLIWGKRQTDFVKKALEEGFFIVAPDSKRPVKIGPKAWDYFSNNSNESIDLPFFQDIFNWLANSSLPVNPNRIYCIGFSSGGFMTSRIAHHFGAKCCAVAIHSGGNADLYDSHFFYHSLKNNININISKNHPPTLIIHGGKDRLLSIDFGINYYNELQKAEIKSHYLINPYGHHIWQSIFNKQILQWFLYGSNASEQPNQPLSGPGGVNYSHEAIKESSYGRGSNKFWIFEPAEPKPVTAPLIVFNHGWGAMHPRYYKAWIDHIVKKGNIVVYPRYQRGFLIGFKYFSSNAIKAVKNAIDELNKQGHVIPDLDKFAITGHSLGGGITANMAARAEEEGLPEPKAIMPVQPAIAYDKKADFSKISNKTLMLVIVGEDDTVVDNKSGKKIFQDTIQIPFTQKDFVIQVTDNYGYPTISADHGAPTCMKNNSILTLDAMDYYCTWKLFDALTDYAFYGINGKFCLGNTSEQRYMGKWSDGTPVKELIVTDTP